MNKTKIAANLVLISCLMSATQIFAQTAVEKTAPATDEIPPWYVSLGGGYIKFEGDEAIKGNGFIQLKLGYDYNPRWSFEG